MKPHGIATAAGLVAFALAGVPAQAQQPGSRQAREFVQAAAQTDQFEIMEATTVLAESKNPNVRAFAQQMIDAHRQTTANLMDAIAKAGVKPPLPGVSGDQSQFLAALQSKRGADFDRAYLRQQTLVHRAALAVEQAYATFGDDAPIRAAAAATVPIIIAHLKMADQIEATQGGS